MQLKENNQILFATGLLFSFLVVYKCFAIVSVIDLIINAYFVVVVVATYNYIIYNSSHGAQLIDILLK